MTIASSRYQHPGVEAVFELRAQYQRWVDVLWAYTGGPPELAGYEVGYEDVAVITEIESHNGHDVAAFLDWARSRFNLPSLGAGLTSSNLVDTGLSLAVRETNRRVVTIVDEALSALYDLASIESETPRMARTHGRPAEPDRFGRQVALWADRVWRAMAEADDAARSAEVASFGGPTGDYSTTDRERAALAATTLRLRIVDTEQAVARDRLSAWVASLARVSTALAHVATQVRLGARDGELSEPTGVDAYKGSSSMPHKRNPTRSERIVGIERVVRALAGAMAESVVWWDQRDISSSSVERIVIPQVASLVAYQALEIQQIVRGLVVHREAMAAGIASHDGTAGVYKRLLESGVDPNEAYVQARAGAARIVEPAGAAACGQCGEVGLHVCE